MTELATHPAHDDLIEQVVVAGNLANLSPEQRAAYYAKTCESLGLNPYTRPFEYLNLQGKLILYARKDATDQLRSRRNVSLEITSSQAVGDLYVVAARARLASGRVDEEIGAVPIAGLKGEALANAMMKATTKAKRRVTLSICGLGMLDETELETIPGARVHHDEPTPIGHAGRQALEEKPAAATDADWAQEVAMMGAEPDAEPPPVPGDDVDSLVGEELAEACHKLRRRLAAMNLPYPDYPEPRTVRSLRSWFHQAAGVAAAAAR